MRLLVRSGVIINSPLGFSRIVDERTRHLKKLRCSSRHITLSLDNPIPRSTSQLKRKDNSSWGPSDVSEFALVLPQNPQPASGILT